MSVKISPLRKQFLAHCAQTSPEPMMIEVARAQGVYLYSPDGKRYMDLVAGVSVSNVGHGNVAVIEAVQHQAQEYMHTMVYGETIQRPQVAYATRLWQLTGFESVYFLNSGAEAIEGALKLAKRATERTEIISMSGAYHGSTHGALSIQGDEYFKTAFRPLLPDCHLIRFNNFEDLASITSRTACVVSEVVQGEAGIRLPQKGYLEALRARCTQVGALLVFDEIQTGFGRSGSLFAFQGYGVRPDILCLAKALGGGMPLGAFLSSEALMTTLQSHPVLGHLTTFGGHPVCCAAGEAALKYILDNNLTDNAERQGALFEQQLSESTAVVEIRRSGLLLAIELGSSEKMYRMVELLTAGGYMTDWFLFCDTAFRISPPLTISTEQTMEACRDIKQILDSL
ncbi:MAG: aminotransferase class III-fold pyridoxal phosphate-dependent enzyme [Mucinivorans sp.]